MARRGESSRDALWITNAIVLTQDSERRVLRGHILIRDGRIAKISRSAPSGRGKGIKVLDAAGKIILPGFVQTHIHLCQTLFRNQADDLELLDWLAQRIWPMEASHTPETLHVSALAGIQELLASGTTCLLDMGTVRHTESIFRAVQESGIRANVGKCLMDHPENTPAYLREPTADALKEAIELFERWNGAAGGRIRASYAPRFVISCSEPLLNEVARLSRESGAIVHTHASENLREIQFVKSLFGCENIEYLERLGLTSPRLVLAHCIWLKPQEMKILQSSGTHVTHCPSSNLKLASGIARVPEMLSRGINVALGADGAPCNNTLDMFQEMRLAALIHKPSGGPRVMRAQEALDMATLNGAKAMGWREEIGSIEAGKRADLFALDLNRVRSLPPVNALGPRPDREGLVSSIVYSAGADQVAWTMVDGRVVARKGRLTRVKGARELPNRIHQAQKTVLQRMKKLSKSK